MMLKIASLSRLFAVSLLMVVCLPACAGGSTDSPRDGRGLDRAAISFLGEDRSYAAYVVDDSRKNAAAAKTYAEGMYLPQALAAFFPTPFVAGTKESKLSYEGDLPFRIVDRQDLGGGVQVYTLESKAAPSLAAAGGRAYAFSFPRSALGSNGAAMQPYAYAADRAIRISELKKGMVRVESLRYEEGGSLFKAVVRVEP